MVGPALLILVVLQAPARALDPLFVASENRDVIEDLTTRYLPEMTPGMAAAWVHQESRWKITAVSKAGARGPLQIMPETARDIRWVCNMPDLDLTNMVSSLKGGFCYGRILRRRVGKMATGADLDEAMLRAYNGGVGYVRKEREEAKKKGKNDAVAKNLRAHCRTFRGKDACEENLSYYPYITKWYRQYYNGWR